MARLLVVCMHSPPVWLCVGLGARGLVYHAWLGRLVAAAVLADSEDGLPAELLAWRDGETGGSSTSSNTTMREAAVREAQ